MDDTLKDILDTLAANGHPLDVTVVTGTQYRDCTFIQHNPPISASAAETAVAEPAAEGDPASASAAPPTPGASPATSAGASGPSAAPAAPPADPPAAPTRDERVAAAIADVMELKDEQGDYLFQYVRQWQGIYRILADRGIVRAGDYKGFTDYIAAIHPAPLRLPPDAKSLSKTDLGLLAKPYKDWASSRYDGTRTTYQRYALIAQAFATRLDALSAAAPTDRQPD